jgi:hypothetical protein
MHVDLHTDYYFLLCYFWFRDYLSTPPQSYVVVISLELHNPSDTWGPCAGSAAAVVSNHISYLDIMIQVTRYFPSFVARGNTEDMPFIGPVR